MRRSMTCFAGTLAALLVVVFACDAVRAAEKGETLRVLIFSGTPGKEELDSRWARYARRR